MTKKLIQRLSGICLAVILLLGMAFPGAAAGMTLRTGGGLAFALSSGSGRRTVTLTRKKKKKNKKKNNNTGNNSGSTNYNAGSSGNDNQKNSNNDISGTDSKNESQIQVEEDGEYTSKEEVAAYLNEFGHLPGNFITKNEAKKLGWVNSEGNLDEVAPGKSIGGDYFGNYEGQLPEKKGRSYYECDIDYTGGYRSSDRIIYSNDGLIYFTGDHYQTFEQLYPQQNGG